MKHIFSVMRGGSLLVLLVSVWLAGPAARAQAPAWQTAMAIDQLSQFSRSGIIASATDASGNVYLAGGYTALNSFGGLILNSTSLNALFVAKWSPVTNTFVWVTQASGTTISNNVTATALAVSGSSVYVAGNFEGTANFGTISLTGSGGTDMFVAKLTDAGTTASFAWVQKGGGSGYETCTDMAVSGSSVYLAGRFLSPTARFGALTLTNADPQGSSHDGCVVKLTDAGSTASFVWVQQTSSNGLGMDEVSALAVSGATVYLAGSTRGGSPTVGGLPIDGVGNGNMFVAKLTDSGATSSCNWAQLAGTGDINALALNGTSLYLAGDFDSTVRFGSTTLTSVGSWDAFVAKVTDTGTAATGVWAQQAGGTQRDVARGLILSGANIYVVGDFTSLVAAFGSTSLVNAGTTGVFVTDVFVAKLTDAGATSSFAWAQRAGGATGDFGNDVTLWGSSVYVCGSVSPPASFGNLPITGFSANTGGAGFLASLTDPTLTATTVARGTLSFSLFPSPARATATVQLPAVPGSTAATLTLTDALGRTVRTQTAALNTRAELDLHGLAPGLYAVQVQAGSSTGTQRLVVE